MKILHVIPAIAKCYGGPSQYVMQLAQALLIEGIDVSIVTTNADGHQDLPVKQGLWIDYEGIPCLFFQRDATESFKYSKGFSQWIKQHVVDYDLLHIHAVFSHLPIAAAKACRQHAIPYIVRPLGTLVPYSMRVKRWKKMLVWHLFAKKMMHKAIAVHYTAPAEKESVESVFGLKRGHVIANAVLIADDDVESQQSPDRPYILSLSRLHPKKALELLIPAFMSAIERTKCSQWQLLIAGEGNREYRQYLEQFIQHHKADDHVVLIGWVDGVQKQTLFKQAELFALTSYHENFGISVAEAMLYGKPVIISDQVEIHDDILHNNAGWVVPVDQQQITDALISALTNTDLRLQRGQAAQQFAQMHYTWPVVAKKIVQLYQTLT